MAAQAQLREMTMRLVRIPPNPHGLALPNSCTSTALSFFLGAGRPKDYWRIWSEFYGHPEASDKNTGNFGLPNVVVEKLYRKYGLKYVQGLVGLPSYPPDCILQLQEPGPKGHVVARSKGYLYDTFDCRKRPYQIMGFYVPAAKVQQSTQRLFRPVKRTPRRRFKL